jgi:NAD(P)H dehydrogenase (quinone)
MTSVTGKRTLLVTGGSGRLAREVIELLLQQGTDHVVTTTRTPAQLEDLRRLGVEVRRLDFDDDEDTLAAALVGADRMLMISTHAVGRRGQQQGRVVTAAKRAGVGHLLYTSCASPNPNPISAVVSDHFWTERAIFASGLSWTILRHNMYSEHVFLFLPSALACGELRTSLGAGARAYVTRRDCAAADAAALLGDWTDCRIYDVGGPQALTTDEVLSIARELTGTTISHIRTSDEESLRSFAASGLPPGFPEAAVGFDICARHGYHALLAPAIRELTGRDPESLRSYLAQRIDALRGGQARVDL